MDSPERWEAPAVPLISPEWSISRQIFYIFSFSDVCLLVGPWLGNVSARCSLGIPDVFQHVWEPLCSVLTSPVGSKAPALTAEFKGCCSWAAQRIINCLKSLWRTDTIQSSASRRVLSGRNMVQANQKHKDIWWRNCLKILAWPGLEAIASKSHFLTRFAPLWRQLFVSANAEWTAVQISTYTPVYEPWNQIGNLDFRYIFAPIFTAFFFKGVRVQLLLLSTQDQW